MGSSLSCFKKQRDGAVRAVPERRPVSAVELQRPASSFTASTSMTLESKNRRSIEIERPSEKNNTVAEVAVERAEKLVPEDEEVQEVRNMNVIDTNEIPNEITSVESFESPREVDSPIAGSTLDDIGATDSANVLVNMHVRAEKTLSETRTNASQEDVVEIRSRGSSVEAEGASKQFFPPPPSLESMPASLKTVTEESVGERARKDKGRLEDTVRPSLVTRNSVGNGRKDSKKKELQRSDTMLDVRSSLPVRTHVTNYERIEAAARVDPEEMVKSGKYKYVAASA